MLIDLEYTFVLSRRSVLIGFGILWSTRLDKPEVEGAVRIQENLSKRSPEGRFRT